MQDDMEDPTSSEKEGQLSQPAVPPPATQEEAQGATTGDQSRPVAEEVPAQAASEVALPGAVVGQEPVASNDRSFSLEGVALHGGVLIEALLVAVDAPPDRPDEASVAEAAQAVIAAAQAHVPGAERLAQRIYVTATSLTGESAGKTSMPQSRRLGRHLMYWLLRELAPCLRRGESVDPVTLQIIGIWLILGLLIGWHPRAKILSKARAAAVRPDGGQAKGWSTPARELTLTLAVKGLTRAIDAAPDRARMLGLVILERESESVEASEWARFNRMFRRRGNNLRTLSSVRAKTGALGHGTLSKGGLAAAGEKLLNGVKAGDETDLLVYLEGLSHLPCETVKEAPIVLRGNAPPEALAWIDLPQRCYCYLLFRLLERGASPHSDQGGDREVSTQVVRIGLSDPAIELLEKCSAGEAADVVPLKQIVRKGGHHPRAAVAGGTGYRVTSRRFQETLPALLLMEGHYRWPVLLSTNSPYLVSAGRDSYGLCRSTAIDVCVEAAHRAIRWPVPRRLGCTELVGSRIVPTASGISSMLNHLADVADSNWQGFATAADAIATLRAVAPWTSGCESLLLALRMRLEYRIPGYVLRTENRVSFNDKHLELIDPVEVPICPTLTRVASGWSNIARAAAGALVASSDEPHCALGRDLLAVLDNPASAAAAYSVDRAGRLVPIGYRTWYDAVPQCLRLAGNFGRQFWPMQLMELGIEQRLLDILMRHQMGGLDLRDIWGTKVPRSGFERLRNAMESVVQRLDLCFPRHWSDL